MSDKKAPPYVVDHLPLPPNVNMALVRHAQDRGVSKRKLEQDILTAWVATVTDWNHPRFAQSLIPIEPVLMPPERWPGYLDSLVIFTPLSLDAPATPGVPLNQQ